MAKKFKTLVCFCLLKLGYLLVVKLLCKYLLYPAVDVVGPRLSLAEASSDPLHRARHE